MTESTAIHPKAFRVTQETTIALYDIADSLLDLGAKESARLVGDAAYALHNANGEIRTILECLKHPRRNRGSIRQWRDDLRRFGWGLSDSFIMPWNPSPLERAAGRSLGIEDVRTDVV